MIHVWNVCNNVSFQSAKPDDRKTAQQIAAAQLDILDEMTGAIGKESRRERSSRSKKVAGDPEEKELRKERKLGRKRVCFKIVPNFYVLVLYKHRYLLQ